MTPAISLSGFEPVNEEEILSGILNWATDSGPPILTEIAASSAADMRTFNSVAEAVSFLHEGAPTQAPAAYAGRSRFPTDRPAPASEQLQQVSSHSSQATQLAEKSDNSAGVPSAYAGAGAFSGATPAGSGINEGNGGPQVPTAIPVIRGGYYVHSQGGFTFDYYRKQ